MKPISEVYEDSKWGWGDYGPMLQSMGYPVLLRVDEDDYEGDSYVLYGREDGAYGLLQFGWGSCSGCDALQACESLSEVENLRDDLHNAIEWYADKTAVIAALERDRSEQWYGSGSEWREFVSKAKEALA